MLNIGNQFCTIADLQLKLLAHQSFFASQSSVHYSLSQENVCRTQQLLISINSEAQK